MEKSDSFAILDINIGDKDKKDMSAENDNNTDDHNKKNPSPFTTVIKIRKFIPLYKHYLYLSHLLIHKH